MLMITDHLERIHKAGVALMHISEDNIYIDDLNNVMFCDWTAAKTINSSYQYEMN